ncbi:MAG: gephyrin-like molybdotransferase Glp, partial [Leifsonia sp.]
MAPLDTQTVALEDALGRVLSAEVRALHPVPLFDNSAMDGYAVRAEDVAGSDPAHPVRLRVVANILAGSSAAAVVGRGEAVRIMTGAPIPPGADCVVPVESSWAGCFDDSPFVQLWASGRTNIRRTAEDIEQRTRLLAAGHTLGARDIGLLAATGQVAVTVHRRPRVAIVSTGDELRRSSDLPEGCIPDSNSLYLAAAARSVGAELSVSLVAPDDRDGLEDVLDRAAADADLVISSGGLGAGSHDLVRQTILSRSTADRPARWASVDMKPGRPQAHGSWQGVPWIALPGNPTATFVSFETFVRPALDRLSGRKPAERGEPHLVSTGWSAPAGALRFVPLRLSAQHGDESVAPAASPKHAGHSIAAMFAAPLIGMVGADVEHV